MIRRRATLASCTIPTPSDASAPEWIELLPAGPEIVGRDGRSWRMDDARQVVADSLKGGAIHVDYEHASETRAPNGEEAPAAGWIKHLEVRDGAIWGRVEWTARAAQMIASKEYRFLSPVFYFEQASRRILTLISAGLTNRPNLDLAALNSTSETDISPMLKDHVATLCRSLGLQDEASPIAILAAVDALKADKDKALNAASLPPALDKFVPRADYDLATNRAATAEAALAAEKSAKIEADIAMLVDEAVKSGKIAPVNRDLYIGMCRRGGVDDFKKLVAQTAPIVGASPLDNKTLPAANATTLTEDERAVCRNLGLDEAAFLKARAA